MYAALAIGTIIAGLEVHLHGDAFAPPSRDVIGDMLWAAMIAWWIGAITPRTSLSTRSVVAVAICFMVEVSQLFSTPTLDMLRRTTAGQLSLGTGFDSRDLLAYSVGVLVAALLERSARHWLGTRSSRTSS